MRWGGVFLDVEDFVILVICGFVWGVVSFVCVVVGLKFMVFFFKLLFFLGDF